MLAPYISFLLTILLFSTLTLLFAASVFQNSQSAFVKIWAVFAYMIILCLILGYTGEDFYVVLVLASELPIFFTFFFFFAVKTELGILVEFKTKTNYFKYLLLLFVIFYVTHIYANLDVLKEFTYFEPVNLQNIPARSDFFIYFLHFYILNQSVIMMIGTLITIATLIIIILTFQMQINEARCKLSKKKTAWTRTQDQSTQQNHNRSNTFFKN